MFRRVGVTAWARARSALQKKGRVVAAVGSTLLRDRRGTFEKRVGVWIRHMLLHYKIALDRPIRRTSDTFSRRATPRETLPPRTRRRLQTRDAESRSSIEG